MRWLSSLRFWCDDCSDDPARWSARKLEEETRRLHAWLDSNTLSDRERAALEKVMHRIRNASARRARKSGRRFSDSAPVSLT